MNAETRLTGGLHQAANPTEQRVENIASFVPSGLAGPESLAKNALMRGVLPGVTSEVAGTIAGAVDPKLEPWARVGGALLAPSGFSRAPQDAAPSLQDLRTAADQGFAAARQSPAYIRPDHTAQWADTTAINLANDGLSDKIAPKTHSVLQELQDVPANAAVSTNNLETVRRTLGNIAGDYMNPSEPNAASRAISGLDDMVQNLKPQQLLAGDAQATANTWADARASYAALKRAEAIAAAQRSAELNTDAGVRQNIGNATRQSFKKFLTSDSAGRGFNDDELAQVERVVRGTTTGNLLRTLGSGLAQGAAAATGGYLGSQSEGPAGAVGGAAVPLLLGALARRGANASVLRQVGKLDDMVRARSPLGNNLASQLAQQSQQATQFGWIQRIIQASLATRNGQPYSPITPTAGENAAE